MMKKIAWWLLVIGGINWLLVGLGGFFSGDWNLVHMIFGFAPVIEWIVYVLVGISAIWLVVPEKKPMMGGQM